MGAIPESWLPILTALQDGGRPMALQDIAKRAGLTAPTVYRHLNGMLDAGLVRRTGRRKDARYTPRPFISAFWTAPVATDRARSPNRVWLRFAWSTGGAVDWRFPLVSRLPDAEAQRIVVRLLDAAWKRGILTPWLSYPQTAEFDSKIPVARQAAIRQKMADPGAHEGTTWVVYGSSARGDARAESDVDLLVILPADVAENDLDVPLKRDIQRLVADINLGAARAIDLVTVTRDAFFDDLPAPLADAIVRQGLTVLSTVPGGDFIETMQGAATE